MLQPVLRVKSHLVQLLSSCGQDGEVLTISDLGRRVGGGLLIATDPICCPVALSPSQHRAQPVPAPEEVVFRCELAAGARRAPSTTYRPPRAPARSGGLRFGRLGAGCARPKSAGQEPGRVALETWPPA